MTGLGAARQRLAFLLETVALEAEHLQATDQRLFAEAFSAERAASLCADAMHDQTPAHECWSRHSNLLGLGGNSSMRNTRSPIGQHGDKGGRRDHQYAAPRMQGQQIIIAADYYVSRPKLRQRQKLVVLGVTARRLQ